MSTRTVLRWNLRQLMAENGMFATTDLVERCTNAAWRSRDRWSTASSPNHHNASTSTCWQRCATSWAAPPTISSSSPSSRCATRRRSTTAGPESATYGRSAPRSAAPATVGDRSALLGVWRRQRLDPTSARSADLHRLSPTPPLPPSDRPTCAVVRPLAWHCGTLIVCASCAGAESIFACRDCGREDRPYGSRRCARCFLRERLTELTTDPATGQIHDQLQPVFDELVNSERPQTGLWWLRKKPGVGPQLLRQMACGALDISHDTFRALPSDRPHDYLRNLLMALGFCRPSTSASKGCCPGSRTSSPTLPPEDAALIRRFAHWHVLRHMREAAPGGRLTKSMTDASRRRIAWRSSS